MLIIPERVTGAVNEKRHPEGGATNVTQEVQCWKGQSKKKLFGQYVKFCLTRPCLLLPSFSAYLRSRNMSSHGEHWRKKDFDRAILDPAPQRGQMLKDMHAGVPVLLVFASSKKGETKE